MSTQKQVVEFKRAKREAGKKKLGVKLYIVKNKGQGNIQLCILIAKGAKAEQKQSQRYLEFVNSIFSSLYLMCFRHSHFRAT